MSTIHHSKEYRERFNDPDWPDMRKRVLAELAPSGRCQRCGDLAPWLELHHKHYFTLGREQARDFEALCHSCHKCADEERKEATASRRFRRRMEGWAEKVYGSLWQLRHDEEDIEERFKSWLERKGEVVYG